MVQEGICQPEDNRRGGLDRGVRLGSWARSSRDRDRAQEAGPLRNGDRRGGRSRGSRPAAARAHADSARPERHGDAPVAIGPEHVRSTFLEPGERGRRRMAVTVPGSGRRHRDRGTGGVEERVGGRGPAAVVGDLEQVNPRDRFAQLGIDLLLDVAGQQELAALDRAEQHDRHVVDAGPGVGWLERDLAAARPQDLEADLVDGDPITRREQQAGRSTIAGQFGGPGRIPGSRAAHAGLEDLIDPVSAQQQRETRDMVLVRMRQDDRIEPAIPGRDQAVELNQQPVGVRTAVDQEAAAARALDEDRVALADVEHGDGGRSCGPLDRDGPGHGRRREQCRQRNPRGAIRSPRGGLVGRGWDHR
jgi:hypothetical protein